MTIKMRLDTAGLRALIAENPELEVEIGREVVKNITDEMLRSSIQARVKAYLATQVVRGGSYYSPAWTLSQPFEAAVKGVVEGAVKDFSEVSLQSLVKDRVAVEMTKLRIELQGEFKALMRDMLTPELATELMREKLLG